MRALARIGRALAVTLVVAGAAVASPAPAGAQPPSLAFTSCKPRQVFVYSAGLQCATLNVPFDRADAAVGNIALAVQRVPASAPRTGVIVLLAGGPGQPALPGFEEALAPLARDPRLRSFELVAFDQRGTGQSEALQCLGGLSSLLTRGVGGFLAECGNALGPTRPFYTSQESVEDLDSLREALGGTPLSLFAVSYGGRVAGMYAREHPDGVARMVLDSPTPPSGPDPLELDSVRALRRVIDEGICGSGDCRSFSRNVYANLVRLVHVLHRHPLRTRIYGPQGRLRRARVTEGALLRLLRGLDLAPTTRELVPAAITAAAHGHAAPLARLTDGSGAEASGSIELDGPSPIPKSLSGEESLVGRAPPSDAAISIALFAATYCIESALPWSAESPPAGRAAALHRALAALPRRASAPFAPATVVGASALPECEHWPATAPAPASPTGVSATPTLILSGEDDLRTPYEQDLTIAAGYSDAELLRVPDDGHSTVTTDETGCARNAMIGFLAAGRAPASCPPSRERQALALPPPSLDDVRPAASRARTSGRVAAAAAITIEDLLGQTSGAGGGLRGGRWALSEAGFVLHGMRDVPGVALSGTIRIGARPNGTPSLTGHLRVRGVLAGTLTLRWPRLSGSVGGSRVHASPRSEVPAEPRPRAVEGDASTIGSRSWESSHALLPMQVVPPPRTG